MALARQAPAGRGYQSSLFYYDYDTFFWNGTIEKCSGKMITDLSMSVGGGATQPARGLNNTWQCSQEDQSPAACPHGFQDDLFIERVEEVLTNSSAHPSTPLFLFYAPHAPHDPYEMKAAQLAKFATIDVPVRQMYASMVNYLDGNFARLEAAVKAAGRWNNTLIVVSSDNGGPADCPYIRAGNNFPLKGSKSTNWEGGIRVNAFVTGGYLDPALRGTVSEELVEVADWWTTFSLLAGADTSDASAAAAGLPPPDGLDLRGLLLPGGNRTSPRHYIVIGDTIGDASSGNTTVGGILRADGWKLLQGRLGNPQWQGPIFPNKSSCPTAPSQLCDPCLFNVRSDPHELHEVAAQHPGIVAELQALLELEKKGVWSPWRGEADPAACENALASGFWGPFLT